MRTEINKKKRKMNEQEVKKKICRDGMKHD